VTKPINRTLRLFHLYPATTHKLPRRWKTKPSQIHYAFHWGIDRIRDRYLTERTSKIV